MTIELMDGRTGEAHISSEDWATFNAATYGVTEGVFDWGDGFKLSMSTSNKGTIGAGAGLVDGKRVWVKTPESVTIESGGQGVKRHDVVGIQYETHSTNLERAVVKVVKGTPSASPADPDLPSKFLPLWRVPLDGLNVGAPVALFEKLPTAAGLRDSVSRRTIHYDGIAINQEYGGLYQRWIDVQIEGGRSIAVASVWAQSGVLWVGCARVNGGTLSVMLCSPTSVSSASFDLSYIAM